MKPISQMTQLEVAAYVHEHLRRQGIDVALSGGSVVSLYSHNLYVSKDVDLINIAFARRSKLRQAMLALGFNEQGRYFRHPNSPHIVEFPNGPLAVGEQPVWQVEEVAFETGVLRVLSATDCVKDRLCACNHSACPKIRRLRRFTLPPGLDALDHRVSMHSTTGGNCAGTMSQKKSSKNRRNLRHSVPFGGLRIKDMQTSLQPSSLAFG